MTDRPILFSAPMVRALLEGRKTQTRRIIKPQPPAIVTSAGVYANSWEGVTNRWTWLSGDPRDYDTWSDEGDFRISFAPGDRLYIKEGWKTHIAYDDLKPSEMGGEEPIRYDADGKVQSWGRYRSGRFMPRWASRLTLLVTDVRVERLQDISEADAIAEGVEATQHGAAFIQLADTSTYSMPRGCYAALWNSVNGPDAWEANPWVVAVTFKVQRRNIDA
jgi:hypothetical protein